jgi:hypothetical protein
MGLNFIPKFPESRPWEHSAAREPIEDIFFENSGTPSAGETAGWWILGLAICALPWILGIALISAL